MEFNSMEEWDWDLQAVVRGCSSTSDELGFSNFVNSPLDFDEILRFCDDELQNGFYDNISSGTEVSHQSNLSSSPTSTCLMSVLGCSDDLVITKEEDKLQKQNYSLSDSNSHNPALSVSSSLTVIKSKKRKNQQKRVVKHVAADEISSDKWAWRKYGQKPIKGSPFPRSYYRCSSLKGCMARKQVERSNEDPSTFIITYTAEHTHPLPTRKNSLAGTTRLKDPNLAKPNQKPIKSKISKLDTIPNTPINPNSVDNLVHHVISTVKNEQEEEIGMPDVIFSEDLFPSLEDIDGLFLDQFRATVP